jgi:hypothetical protein
MTSPNTSDPSPLNSLQHWFQAAVTHPGGVTADGNAAAVDATIAPSSRQTPAERLTVYAQSYWARLVHCLEEEFPTVRAAVGDEAFAQFAVGYLEAFPSTSYTLGRLSDRFVDYLRHTAAGPSDGLTNSWSQAVVEIALLERAITDVFDASGGETLGYLTPADLQAVPADLQAELRLTLLPTVRLLAFDHDVNAYFTAVHLRHGDASPPWPERRPTFVALSRRGYIVRRHELSRPEFVLLSLLAGGATLGQAIESLAAEPEIDLEAAFAALGGWFAAWAAAGLFQSPAVVAA